MSVVFRIFMLCPGRCGFAHVVFLSLACFVRQLHQYLNLFSPPSLSCPLYLHQVKAQLNEAGDLLTKQVPKAGARVGMGTVEALKGAAANTEIGNPVKEAAESLQQVGDTSLPSRKRALSTRQNMQLSRTANDTSV